MRKPPYDPISNVPDPERSAEALGRMTLLHGTKLFLYAGLAAAAIGTVGVMSAIGAYDYFYSNQDLENQVEQEGLP